MKLNCTIIQRGQFELTPAYQQAFPSQGVSLSLSNWSLQKPLYSLCGCGRIPPNQPRDFHMVAGGRGGNKLKLTHEHLWLQGISSIVPLHLYQ
jgi:hypothetical protein